MSKIFEWVKKDKCKALIIGIGGLIFIVGMAIVVANSGGTYAASNTNSNYTVTFKCADGSDSCAEGDGLPQNCTTDRNGYIDNDCLTFIKKYYYIFC